MQQISNVQDTNDVHAHFTNDMSMGIKFGTGGKSKGDNYLMEVCLLIAINSETGERRRLVYACATGEQRVQAAG